MSFNASGNFCGLEIRHRIFRELHFGPGIFCPCQLKSGVPPPPAIMRQIMAQSIRSLAVIMVVKQLSCPELGERFGYAVKCWTKSSSRLVTNSCRRVLFSSRQFIESTRRLVKLSR